MLWEIEKFSWQYTLSIYIYTWYVFLCIRNIKISIKNILVNLEWGGERSFYHVFRYVFIVNPPKFFIHSFTHEFFTFIYLSIYGLPPF